MSDVAAQIERIVRQVLAEMRSASSPPREAPPETAGGKEAAGGPAEDVSHQAGDWVVAERVVTLARLPERWDAVQRVVVPAGAVVTPAVHDELLRRGVALVFRPSLPTGTTAGRVRVVSVSRSYDPAGLVRTISQMGFQVESERRECLIEATDRLAEDLAAGLHAAVLLSRHTAASLCLANRHRRVRAILATTPEQVVADASAVGANLLVLDPRAHSPFATAQCLRAFVQGIPRSCPEVFQTRLA